MKPKSIKFWLPIHVAGLMLAFSGIAAGQAPGYYSVPTGHQPLGVALVKDAAGNRYAAVANSGSNSVSVYKVNLNAQGGVNLALISTIIGVPSPYGVADCYGAGIALVTSPSDNSVRLIGMSSLGQWQVLGTLKTGQQPYAAACFPLPASPAISKLTFQGAVSNRGDSSVVVFDVPSLAIVATLQGIPGSGGFHGISVEELNYPNSSPYGVVAGTDFNGVTVLQFVQNPLVYGISNPQVLKQLPFAQPTAVFFNTGGTHGSGAPPPHTFGVASAQANSLYIFEAGTGKVDQIIQNVPNPQDATGGSDIGNAGAIATIGGADSICWVDGSGNVRIIPGIPRPTSVAADLSEPTAPPTFGWVLVTSTSTDSLYVLYLPLHTPSQFGISNGASFSASPQAPGSLASAFASNGVSQPLFANSVPLPKILGGVSLNIGGTLNFDTTSGKWIYSSTVGVQAALLYVGPNQVNFQIPPGIAPGNGVPAQLTKPDGTTLLTTLNLTATAPGIFSSLQNGLGQGAVINQDSSQNGPFAGEKPAARGTVIQIFATGGGETTPSLLPGQAADPSGNPLVLTNVQPTVTIGGQQATVQFSGMAPGYVGLWQVNAQIPQSVTPGNAVPLVVTAGGVASNTVTIAVQ